MLSKEGLELLVFLALIGAWLRLVNENYLKPRRADRFRRRFEAKASAAAERFVSPASDDEARVAALYTFVAKEAGEDPARAQLVGGLVAFAAYRGEGASERRQARALIEQAQKRLQVDQPMRLKWDQECLRARTAEPSIFRR